MSHNETILFVSIPGATEYQELSKSEVKRKIAKGDLPAEVLVWSEKNNQWKSPAAISSLIELPQGVAPDPKLSSQMTPASGQPAQVTTSSTPYPEGQPKVQVARVRATGNLPKVKAQAAAPVAGKQAVVSPKAGHAKVPTTPGKSPNTVKIAAAELERSRKKKNAWVKWLCAFVGAIVIGLLTFNWFYVNAPLQENLSRTQYRQASVFGHLGGFFQANTLALHVWGTPDVLASDVPEFIQTLAQNTPHEQRWDQVSLSSGWLAEYYLTGNAWRDLKEKNLNGKQIKDHLIDNLRNASGGKLMPTTSSLNFERTQKMRTAIWDRFARTIAGRD